MKFAQLIVFFSALTSVVAGKGGKGGKGGKKGMMDDDEMGGAYYDSCVFANPALDLKYLQLAGGAPDTSFLLEHSQLQMAIFQECLEVLLYDTDSGDLSIEEALTVILIKGYIVGQAHLASSSEIEWEDVICYDFGDMVLAMGETCYFDANVDLYVIVSFLLHEGFYIAFNEENGTEWTLEEGCIWFDEWLGDDWGDDDDDDDDYRRRLGQGEEKKPSLKESTKNKLMARFNAHRNGDKLDLGNWKELKKTIKPSLAGGFA